ncbi:hypothetical protein NE237_008294 [Protea cynaroides]|uniref:Uncharacterized protein n=1 Tax=Protea cynaroides TaxID=273540 RepID=A0A9Q0GP75_9MAGN|nr:hypothetical protein NE237_008294 [Protea cynaroides]
MGGNLHKYPCVAYENLRASQEEFFRNKGSIERVPDLDELQNYRITNTKYEQKNPIIQDFETAGVSDDKAMEGIRGLTGGEWSRYAEPQGSLTVNTVTTRSFMFDEDNPVTEARCGRETRRVSFNPNTVVHGTEVMEGLHNNNGTEGTITLGHDVKQLATATKSIAAIFMACGVDITKALKSTDPKSEADKLHPLAMLADDLKLIIKRESTVIYPILFHWYPTVGILASMLLHQLYGDKLVSL